MSKEKQNVFICLTPDRLGLIGFAVGFNRGHAAKQLAKSLEARGETLKKTDIIEQVDLTKAQVFLYTE